MQKIANLAKGVLIIALGSFMLYSKITSGLELDFMLVIISFMFLGGFFLVAGALVPHLEAKARKMSYLLVGIYLVTLGAYALLSGAEFSISGEKLPWLVFKFGLLAVGFGFIAYEAFFKKKLSPK